MPTSLTDLRGPLSPDLTRPASTMRRVAAVYGRCLSGSDRTTGLAQVQSSEKEFALAIRDRCKGI